MREYQITAIRPDAQDVDRRIDGLQIEGTIWPIEKVIGWVRDGTHAFWVKADAGKVRVIVARHWMSGRYFLTTEGEGFPPNALLALRHVY
ncbi:MAG: DUF3892 domain-containing protein [Sphingopyxis sp.]|nr:DUF3892 domain-containing protein [Sphingopyxis sp.]